MINESTKNTISKIVTEDISLDDLENNLGELAKRGAKSRRFKGGLSQSISLQEFKEIYKKEYLKQREIALGKIYGSDAISPITGEAYAKIWGGTEEWMAESLERRIEIVEADLQEHDEIETEAHYEASCVGKRFAEGIERSCDRLDAVSDAFSAAGYTPVAVSAASAYFEVGDKKIRVSDHDPKPTYEMLNGVAYVDIDTNGSWRGRSLATRQANGSLEDIRQLVADIIKEYEVFED